MRVAINLLTEDPNAPSGAHWFWTRVIPEMAERLHTDEELHLIVSPKCKHLYADFGPNVRYITFPWSNERRSLRTLSEHLLSPLRLPLSRIDVLNTLMAPVINPSWSLVIHMKTMHAYTTPAAISPAVRAYRTMSYPRSARLADAIVINSESLRSEITKYLDVDQSKLRLIYEAVDHDLFKPGDPGAARAALAKFGITKPFALFVSSLWPYKNCDGLLRAGPGAGRPGRPATGYRRRRAGRKVLGRAAFADDPARDRWRRRLRRRRPARGDSDLLPGGRCPRVPVAGGNVWPTHPGGNGLWVPGRHLKFELYARGRRGRSPLVRPPRPGLDRPSHRRCDRSCSQPSSRPGRETGRSVHMVSNGGGHTRCVPRSRRTPAAPSAMKVLVTGGAGFIGSHTCDRLLSRGHQVIVLDALTPPVHRNGPPDYLSRDVEFFEGDVRNRELLTNLVRRVDAVYHFAAYQDYLTDFSRFTDVNVVSTALLYEIIVAERLDVARVVVASSQAAMGEGLYCCPVDGEQNPNMRPEAVLAAGQWEIPCPECSGPLLMQPTPERVSNPQNPYGMSKFGQEMVAVNLGHRYAIPTVALRYSIVQGHVSRSTTPTPAPAGSSALITCRVGLRSFTRMGWPSATTSTSTTWWMPMSWCSTMTTLWGEFSTLEAAGRSRPGNSPTLS